MTHNDEMFIINHNDDIKEAFGSYAILDQFEVWEQPAIYKFARIVRNYLMMQKKLDEINNENKNNFGKS